MQRPLAHQGEAVGLFHRLGQLLGLHAQHGIAPFELFQHHIGQGPARGIFAFESIAIARHAIEHEGLVGDEPHPLGRRIGHQRRRPDERHPRRLGFHRGHELGIDRVDFPLLHEIGIMPGRNPRLFESRLPQHLLLIASGERQQQAQSQNQAQQQESFPRGCSYGAIISGICGRGRFYEGMFKDFRHIAWATTETPFSLLSLDALISAFTSFPINLLESIFMFLTREIQFFNGFS